MNAIAINGSPRTGGNTEILLKRCLERLKAEKIETEFVSVGTRLVKPCTACGQCAKMKNKTCAVKDDEFHPIFASMVKADIIVLGSPVYFGSATPNLMALLDRAGYVSRANGGLFARKLGGPIAVARRAGQNFTYAQLAFWYTINDMIVAGSTYWNIAIGRQAGDVKEGQEGLQTIDRFAENLAWLAHKLQA